MTPRPTPERLSEPPKVHDLIRTASIAGKIDALVSSGHPMHTGIFSESDSELIGRVFNRLIWLEEQLAALSPSSPDDATGKDG